MKLLVVLLFYLCIIGGKLLFSIIASYKPNRNHLHKIKYDMRDRVTLRVIELHFCFDPIHWFNWKRKMPIQPIEWMICTKIIIMFYKIKCAKCGSHALDNRSTLWFNQRRRYFFFRLTLVHFLGFFLVIRNISRTPSQLNCFLTIWLLSLQSLGLVKCLEVFESCQLNLSASHVCVCVRAALPQLCVISNERKQFFRWVTP